jgi:hypothetical protein
VRGVAGTTATGVGAGVGVGVGVGVGAAGAVEARGAAGEEDIATGLVSVLVPRETRRRAIKSSR